MKKILGFLLHFVLSNFIWILPLACYSYYNNTVAIFFTGLMVTLVYCEWVRYNNPKSIVIQRTAKIIDYLYKTSVIGFLGLTFWATTEGIVNLFGLIHWYDYLFAALFSLFIITTLYGITLMIKNRRSPGLILALILTYLLFDSLTALPFNFLFFYEKIKNVESVNNDKEILPDIIKACDAYAKSNYDSALKVLHTLDQRKRVKAAEDSANVHNRLNFALRKLTADSQNQRINRPDQFDHIQIEDRRAGIYKRYNYRVITLSQEELAAFEKAKTDSLIYTKQLNEIGRCRKLQANLSRENNTHTAGKFCDSVKALLYPLCANSTDTTIQKMTGLIVTREMPQLESIKELYRYIGRKLHIVEIENNDDDKTVENNMLITMSLSSSVVIDILPLLLSILYARFNRED